MQVSSGVFLYIMMINNPNCELLLPSHHSPRTPPYEYSLGDNLFEELQISTRKSSNNEDSAEGKSNDEASDKLSKKKQKKDKKPKE